MKMKLHWELPESLTASSAIGLPQSFSRPGDSFAGAAAFAGQFQRDHYVDALLGRYRQPRFSEYGIPHVLVISAIVPCNAWDSSRFAIGQDECSRVLLVFLSPSLSVRLLALLERLLLRIHAVLHETPTVSVQHESGFR